MSSPIMHVAAGGLIFRGLMGRLGVTHDRARLVWGALAVCLFFSMAPDVDAAFGIGYGDFGNWHNQATHSAVVALAVALVMGIPTALLLPGVSYARRVSLIVLCLGVHLALDWMTVGRGLMLFWPLSTERFQSPVKLFFGVQWARGFWAPQHLMTVFNEMGILLAGFALATVIRRSRAPDRKAAA